MQPTVGALVRAPAAGVLTAWAVHGNTGGPGSLALRVLRALPTAGSTPAFSGIATSARVTAAFADGSPSHPTQLPVQVGDYIGVDLTSGGNGIAQIAGTNPAGATWDLFVPALPDGTSSSPATSLPERLIFNATETLQPAITVASPASGPTTGGQSVTITGTDLDSVTSVTFGGVPATSFTASATQITAIVPAGAQGTVRVLVSGPAGASPPSGADLYSYLAPGAVPPSILSRPLRSMPPSRAGRRWPPATPAPLPPG